MDFVSTATLRIIIVVIGVLILIGIYFFGRPGGVRNGQRLSLRRGGAARIEPVLDNTGAGADSGTGAGRVAPRQDELDAEMQRELDRLGAEVAATRKTLPSPRQRVRAAGAERVVSVYVVAPGNEHFHGSDIVVAAERAGLRFGAMRIFHRMADGRPDAGPVFSMASMVKPGYFDMNRISELVTPGLAFFIALPGPLPALDAWDAMLPNAQRIAELLGGEVLDENHSALGRQRIAGLREELRDWDRRHEGETIKPRPRH